MTVGESVDGLLPVVGGGSGAQQTRGWWGNAGCNELPDTLLGFETTGPLSLRPECGKPEMVIPRGWGALPGRECGCCCPDLWWWGVVFDLWIVVASIERARVRAFLGCGFLCV